MSGAARAYYNENDPFAAQWLRNLIAANLIAPGDVDDRSITEVRPADLLGYTQCHFFAGIGVWSYALRRAGWPGDRPVWTASCPCQPFSAAGLGEAESDQRHLWPVVWRLVDRLPSEQRPPVILGEQVASAAGRVWLAAVRADLEELGYAVAGVDFGAAGVGAPHIRQRIYWVADANEIGQQRAGEARNGRHGPADSCPAGDGMANSSGGGFGIDGSPSREAGHVDIGSPSNSADGGRGPAHHARPQGRGVSGKRPGELPLGSPSVAGFWTACDWLSCSDNKARPVEPGTFPLVDGAAFKLGSGQPWEGKNRVGLLRGYGNAINAEQAVAFIQSYLDLGR